MITKDGFENIVNTYGITAESIVATLKCDLSAPGTYGESFVYALDDSVCSVGSDGAFIRKKYSEIEDIYTQNFVSSGSIVVKCTDCEIVLAYFTLTVSANVEWFLKIARKLISGEKVDAADFVLRKNDDFSYLNNGRKKLFFRVMSYLPRYKKHLFQMVFIIILVTLINLIPPYLTGTVLYDEVLNTDGKFAGQIISLVLMLVLISLTTVLLGVLQGRIGAEMSGNIIYDIKTEVFSAMQKLGMSFFTSKRTGNLMNRINSDALDIQYFLNDGLPNFIINGLTICAVGLFLFIKNPLLSIAVLIPVPLIALIIKKSSRVFKKLKWRTWRSSSNMNSAINDTFLGVRVVKAFGKEEREIKRFSETSNRLYENRIKEGIASAKVFPLLTWIMTLGSLAVWGLGGGQVMSGKLTFGELMTFVAYLSLLYNPVNFMVKTFDWWTNCMNSAQRIFEVIDRKTDVPEAENPIVIDKMKGDIELKNVTFAYEPNRTVLKDVSFKVKQGEMIGLVGHSGAGKSTITNIITRLYDVNDGEILIDGINVKNISFTSLRSNIGMVLQEPFLFSGTVAENISYGKPDASVEEIILASKKAHAHEFISALPDGYDTLIGRGGADLSGGEKQRISIARAILMDPAILIFDEATSSLDTKTEQQIHEAMQTLIKGRTTIAIAHRLSTLKNADRLIVVENGCVVEEGTHKELFEKPDGVYSAMAKKQMDSINVKIAPVNPPERRDSIG